jgi:hypothetical protein
MTTDFQIISGTTVPETYFWDIGNPLETTPTTVIADSTTEYISGYAPGVKVIFKPNITDLIYAGFANVSATYIWNFGDYYNSASNIAVLPCQEIIEHTYVLPGKYNVSLTNIQSKENQPQGDEDDKCFGKYKIGWYWDNLKKTDLRKTTWNETMCFPPATAVNKRPKWWSEEDKCFQKFCKVWNWKDLSPAGKNPLFWYQTYKYGDYYKRWDYEANLTVCTVDEAKATIDTTEQTAIKTYIVEVKEIMPVAAIYNNTIPLTGYSPYTFRLSPIHSKTGSFPIDRIEWNAGDGTSTKIVTRYSTPDSKYFTYNNAYFSDPQDPRNYDFVYTITRNANTYPVFYPSLTCYSASTNSSDSCSIIVGPILLQPQTKSIQLLKAKNTIKGDFYGIEIDKNITILTTLTSSETKTQATVIQTQPTSPVKQVVNTDPIIFFGNTGENYPPPFTPSCTYTPSEPTLIYLTTEENELSGIFLEDTTLLYK